MSAGISCALQLARAFSYAVHGRDEPVREEATFLGAADDAHFPLVEVAAVLGGRAKFAVRDGDRIEVGGKQHIQIHVLNVYSSQIPQKVFSSPPKLRTSSRSHCRWANKSPKDGT